MENLGNALVVVKEIGEVSWVISMCVVVGTEHEVLRKEIGLMMEVVSRREVVEGKHMMALFSRWKIVSLVHEVFQL